jgi:ribosome maturation factor RimP
MAEDGPGTCESHMRNRKEIEREVERRLAQALPRVDLLEVTVSGGGDSAMLKVVIDHPEGVDHDLCAEVTHALEAAGLRDEFGIEVWSPGPERPLRTERHFQEALGHRIKVWRADTRRRPQTARLTTVAGDEIVVEVAGEPVTIPLAEVRRAHLAPEEVAQ